MRNTSKIEEFGAMLLNKQRSKITNEESFKIENVKTYPSAFNYIISCCELTEENPLKNAIRRVSHEYFFQ